MGIDFVRSRESHLTITHDAVYRKLYKVIESESFALGDRVLVELTNGMYEHCIVVSSDPLNLAPYEKKHYVSEDKMYRGTFIPEYLRKGTVSSTADGADSGTSSSSSDSSDTSSSDDTSSTTTEDGSGFIPNADDMKDLPNPNDWNDYSHLYNPCTCADGCKGCKGKDCGKSMLGHWGYEHLFCHCHDEEEIPVDEPDPVDHDSGTGDDPGTGDDTPTEPTYPDVPCFCKVCHKICLSDCPYVKTVFDIEVPESLLPDATEVNGKIVLPSAAPFDMTFRVEIEDDLGVKNLIVSINKGELEASFTELFAGIETTVRASYNGKTIEKQITIDEFPVEFELFTCETETISIGKPLQMRLRFVNPVKEQSIVRITVDRVMVCPERIVFDTGEQEKTFTVVIWDDENEITAHYNDKEISCRVDEEKFPYIITDLTATDDIVVGETFSIRVHVDRAVERNKTIIIDVSDDSMMLFPPTAFIQTGEDVVTVQGMFAHSGTGTVTVTLGENSMTKTLSC